MKSLVVSLFLMVLSNEAPAFITVEDYFKKVDFFLDTYVANGQVDYKGIVKNFPQVEKLYYHQFDIDLSNASDEVKKAFYINAYNLIVIYQVAKYYEFTKTSPMDQSGFFDRVRHRVAGEMLTLNQLEIKKLLLIYQDARIHFVLACAAKSCPPLADFAFHPDYLEKQLEDRTRLAINNKYWLKLDNGQKIVSLSKIFDWYKKDFTRKGLSLIQYINQYREIAIPDDYKVTFYKYDWSLNEG